MTSKKNKAALKNENESIQSAFIARMKDVLPPGLGLAEEIADILDISTDSAYRRIRGETEISVREASLICKKYALSMDEVFNLNSGAVTFAYTKLTDNSKDFHVYLSRILAHLNILLKADSKKIVYVAEEIPMFHSFTTEKLTEFKLFYWLRSVINSPEFQKSAFQFGSVDQELIQLARKIHSAYLQIPSTEIWTVETVYTGLRQIRFYFESGLLTSADALVLLNEYSTMISKIKEYAETGTKTHNNQNAEFTLLKSEVVLGTNCIFVQANDARFSYISFNSVNSLTTNNTGFCDETQHWIKNLEKKSTMISGVDEKQRYQFFKSMNERIQEFITYVQSQK